jgi:CBS domain protein
LNLQRSNQTQHVPPTSLVAEAMLQHPTLHDPTLSPEDLWQLFRNDHLHMALLVEGRKLVAAVERRDLHPGRPRGSSVGSLSGRTIGPDEPIRTAIALMQRTGRRRLAVVDAGTLLGLLCLKASGGGFCSDEDVRNRKEGLREGRTGSSR